MEENDQRFRGEQDPGFRPDSGTRQPKKKRLGLRIAALAVGCALLGGICGGALVAAVTGRAREPAFPEGKPEEPSSATEAWAELPTESGGNPAQSGAATLTPAQIYARYVSGVVGVANESTTLNVFGQETPLASSGTGFLITEDGEILTNYHVIKGASRLTVTLYDGREFEAAVLGYEEISDVALLKIEAADLQPVRLGNSDRLKVGDPVAAIGNPLGELTYTMTVGYVSAKDRAVNTDGTPINMMQIDAAINAGNSGGPLFDMRGNVVGINTAKYSGAATGGAAIEGIGFAIPINDAREILDDLRENGAVLDRAYIGITVSNVNRSDAGNQDLPDGAWVAGVVPGGCGEQAGLRQGDVIVAIDGSAIQGTSDLSSTLKHYRAGDEARLSVYRNGRTLELTIVFDERPLEREDASAATAPEEAPEPTEDNRPGWEFPWNFLP